MMKGDEFVFDQLQKREKRDDDADAWKVVDKLEERYLLSLRKDHQDMFGLLFDGVRPLLDDVRRALWRLVDRALECRKQIEQRDVAQHLVGSCLAMHSLVGLKILAIED